MRRVADCPDMCNSGSIWGGAERRVDGGLLQRMIDRYGCGQLGIGGGRGTRDGGHYSPAASVDQPHRHLIAADSSGGQGRARKEPLRWSGRLVVASTLGRMGALVVAPLDLAGPVVHRFGRWEMTFWPYHAQTGATPEPVALGRALERLHDLLDEAARREGWSLAGWDQGPQGRDQPARRRGFRADTELR